MRGDLGYQSAWTDPVNGRVDMGARWYDPAVGQFTSRDTAGPSPDPDSAAANPFAYGGDDPLTETDPTGHLPIMIDPGNGQIGSIQYVTHHPAPPPGPPLPPPRPRPRPRPAPQHCGLFDAGCWLHKGENAVKKIYHKADKLAHKVVHAVKAGIVDGIDLAGHYAHDAGVLVDDLGSVAVNAVTTDWHTLKSAAAAVTHTVTKWAVEGYHTVTHVVKTAAHYAVKAATATVDYVKHHAAAIASFVVSTAVFLGCDATLGAVTAGVGVVACGALAGAIGNAVSYGITAAQNHDFSWSGLLKTAAVGAIAGALGGAFGGGELGDEAGDLLADGAESDASSLADSASAEGAGNDDAAAAADNADASTPAASEDAGTPSADTEESESGAGVNCGGESFTARTKVRKANGTLVSISKLRPGAKVLATNTKTGKTSAETVAAVLVHHDTDLYDLTVRTAHGTAVIDTTRNHLFWDAGDHRWVKAAALKYGTRLRTPGGAAATVTGGHDPKVTVGWMWDLTIPGNDDHDFYVQTAATAVLVHNTSCGPGDESAASGGEGEGFRNLEYENKQTDLAEAREAGVTPTEPGTDTFNDYVARSPENEVKWGVLPDGSLKVVPTEYNGTEIYHSVLNGDVSEADDRLLAAGTATFERSEDGWVGRSITNYSGHYQPDPESVSLGQEAFARYGISFDSIDTL
jgi:RHS repeat-associated protein